ncbi:MAG TPA: AMP-binding protein, partial [Kiloniellales bacterium]
MTDRNLYSAFDRVFEGAGGKTAFVAAGGATLLTYADLRKAAGRYANALIALGIEPGDRVAVQVEKSLANVLLYLAAMKVGAVYQPLNAAYTEAEVEYFVGDAGPELIVCDPSRQKSMRQLADRHRVAAVVNLDAKGEGSLADL